PLWRVCAVPSCASLGALSVPSHLAVAGGFHALCTPLAVLLAQLSPFLHRTALSSLCCLPLAYCDALTHRQSPRMNEAKLKKLQQNVRIGGKGTPRRKHKVQHKSAGGDDKKLQFTLKRLGVQPIQGIDEVNLFRDDGKVIHFAGANLKCTLHGGASASH